MKSPSWNKIKVKIKNQKRNKSSRN